jgi:hypothetical protein
MVSLTQTEHLSCTDANTVSKQIETRFHTTHVTYEFHRVRPKLFVTYGTFNANRAPIFCSIISKRTKQISTRPSSPRSTVGASKTIYEPMVRWTQAEHLSCTDASTVSKTDQNKIPHDPRNLGVPSGASNTISEPTVRSMQTVHQSCIKSSTISKWTVPSFHLSLIT